MTILDIMRTGPVIPVVVLEELGHAVPLARALVAGGVRVIEVTLRTPVALAAVRAIAGEVHGAIVGVGTITRPRDVALSLEAGAAFGVSPGLTPDVAAAAGELGLPLLPGVMTPSDVMAARAAGFSELKFFPAQPAGGVAMLKAMAGPFPDVTFCPTGGITSATARDFLALPNVGCVGGSWIAPPDLLAAHDWHGIEGLARQTASLLSKR